MNISNITIKNIEKKLNLVAKDVKAKIDEAINEYYLDKEYCPPKYYIRTDQLRKCCKISEPIIKGNKITVYVYLDIKSLDYKTEGAIAYETIESANVGLHGGWTTIGDTSTGKHQQISYSKINSSKNYGGTSIWHEPIKKLKKNELKELFIKYGLIHGINFIS